MTTQPGLLASDHCKFCGTFFAKVRPYVCPECFTLAMELAQAEGWTPPQSTVSRLLDTMNNTTRNTAGVTVRDMS